MRSKVLKLNNWETTQSSRWDASDQIYFLRSEVFFSGWVCMRGTFSRCEIALCAPLEEDCRCFFYKLCYKAFECWSLGFEAVVSHRVLCCLTGFDEVCTQRLQDAGCFSSFLQVDPRCFKSQKQETNSVFLMEERSRRRSNYWINQMLRESNPALSKADGMCRCVNAYFVDASLQITVTWEAAGILGWVLHHSCSWHH